MAVDGTNFIVLGKASDTMLRVYGTILLILPPDLLCRDSEHNLETSDRESAHSVLPQGDELDPTQSRWWASLGFRQKLSRGDASMRKLTQGNDCSQRPEKDLRP